MKKLINLFTGIIAGIAPIIIAGIFGVLIHLNPVYALKLRDEH